MDINNMRNIVILKELPSNLIEEAFVVLKKNQKIKKLEYADNTLDNFSKDNYNEDNNNFVVREAELLISNYISKIEKQDLNGNIENSELIKKCKKLKRNVWLLASCLIISLAYIMFI